MPIASDVYPMPHRPLRLCVFPGDAMKTFAVKGELKPRYYNPQDLFDEIHFMTFVEKDIEPEKVQLVAGRAKVFIHALGRLSVSAYLTKRQAVLRAVHSIHPDVIRAYTPSLHGFFAAYASRKLRIPYVMSLHGDFDRDTRYFFWKTGQYRKWLPSLAMKYFTERFAISSADRVICAYSFLLPYARAYGARDPVVIYNKVYAERFRKAKPALKLDKPAIICVGRMIPEKNQECLIRAMPGLSAYLILIGDGSEYPRLVSLAKSLGIEKQVLFFRSVPNVQIAPYYKSATIFALPIKYGGIAIPVIEAMAAGLPVVVARPELDPNPEFASEAGLVINNTPKDFHDAIKRLLNDASLRRRLSANGRRIFSRIEGRKMEQKEAGLYRDLLSKKGV